MTYDNIYRQENDHTIIYYKEYETYTGFIKPTALATFITITSFN